MSYTSRLDEAAAEARSTEKSKSVAQLVMEYGVSRSSLQHRKIGRESITTAKKLIQNLSPKEERVLYCAIKHLNDCNWAPTKRRIVELAEQLMKTRENDSCTQFGKHWVDRFLKRSSDLKSAWSRPLTNVRANTHDADSLLL